MAGLRAGVRERFGATGRRWTPAWAPSTSRRKEYEESVTRINEAEIGSYLEAEQEMAQGMFPHYFEKQQTDGIDYSMYVGRRAGRGRRASTSCT